jgi:hypothetical protein
LEADRLFNEEIAAKKADRKNLRSKTGSKGSSKSRKGIRTAYDYMTPKERKKLNGIVEVSSLYDVLQNKEWFEGFPPDKQKEILIHWRDIHPNAKIMEALEIKSQGTFNKFLENLGVPKKRSWSKKKAQQQPHKKEIQPMENQKEEIVAAAVPEREKMDIVIFDGLSLNYNGVYSADQIERILTKLQLIVAGEENSFIMSISLQEKK